MCPKCGRLMARANRKGKVYSRHRRGEGRACRRLTPLLDKPPLRTSLSSVTL